MNHFLFCSKRTKLQAWTHPLVTLDKLIMRLKSCHTLVTKRIEFFDLDMSLVNSLCLCSFQACGWVFVRVYSLFLRGSGGTSLFWLSFPDLIRGGMSGTRSVSERSSAGELRWGQTEEEESSLSSSEDNLWRKTICLQNFFILERQCKRQTEKRSILTFAERTGKCVSRVRVAARLCLEAPDTTGSMRSTRYRSTRTPVLRFTWVTQQVNRQTQFQCTTIHTSMLV